MIRQHLGVFRGVQQGTLSYRAQVEGCTFLEMAPTLADGGKGGIYEVATDSRLQKKISNCLTGLDLA
jgi:hypothetical protein